MTVPVTIVTRTVTGQDSRGNDLYGETQTTVQGVFAPGTSAENAAAGSDVVVTQPTVYLPDGVVPKATDVLVVDGVRWQADGDPRVWPANPFTGWRPPRPVEVPLRKATGG